MNRLSILSAPALLLALALPTQAQKVEPTTTGTGNAARWTFTHGPVSFQSGPKRSGRIHAVQYNGANVLHMDTGSATNYGSTFWPSPQAGWQNTPAWPPATNIDGANNNFTAEYADTTLFLRGATDNSNQVRINKAYWLNAADTSISMRFTLINTAATTKSWAPWQVTRLPAGGIYLFPKGEGAITGDLAGGTRDSLGHIWFKYDSSSNYSGTKKFYADGSNGWFAHLSKDRVLLIKKFTDTPLAQKAPSPENEIELYTDPNKKFVEMEPQGPYTAIPSGDSVVWDVKWYVRKMPDTTTVAVGNVAILNYINSVLSGGGTTAINGKATRSDMALRMTFAGEGIRLSLQNATSLSLVVMDARGATVQRLHSGMLEAGTHAFRLAPAAKGLYWVVLRDARGKDLEVRAVPRI